MYALIAALPIIFSLVSMAIFNWSGIKALSTSLLITIVIAMLLWKIPSLDIISYGVLGFLESLNIVLIILGAILLLNILTKVGAMNVINNSFNSISRDQRVQILLIGFIFNGFLCGIAAFGSEIALSTLILIALGLPAFPAAAVSIMFNGPVVTFGAVGIPTVTAANYTKDLFAATGGDADAYVQKVIETSALLHTVGAVVISILVMFIVIKLFAKNKSWKPFIEILPFTVFSTLAFMIPFYLSAKYIGAETPLIIGSLVGLLIVITAIKLNFLIPKNVWTFPPKETWPAYWSPSSDKVSNKITVDQHVKIGLLKAWFPYIFASALLIITRIPGFLNDWFSTPAIKLTNLLGLEKVDFTFKYLYSPGIMPFIFLSIVCIFIYKMNTEDVKTSLQDTYKKAKGAVIAIILAVIMVKIMQGTSDNPINLDGMLTTIANMIANLKGVGSIIASPFIGALGAFVSGSNTTSNILFVVIQYNIAEILNIPPHILVSLQNVGGGSGVTFCIKSVVIAASVAELTNAEGRLLKMNLAVCVLYMIVLLITAFTFLYLF